MEEIIPALKNMLKKAIDTEYDESKLLIIMKVIPKIRDILAVPEEIVVMFKMFGGIREDIPMDISINNETQTISIKVNDKPNYHALKKALENLWENAVDMLDGVINGDYTLIKDIPNVDD